MSGSYFEYTCSNGHFAGAPMELTRCPACCDGLPCLGDLTRIGQGSRQAAAVVKAQKAAIQEDDDWDEVSYE